MHKLFKLLFITCILFCSCSDDDNSSEKENLQPKRIKVGVYYFGGWAGVNALSEAPEEQEWAKDAPTHLTKSLFYEYSDRQPIWGWRDDSLEIMEEQIDLAADNGVDFFMFCWYWSNDKGSINNERIDNFSAHKCIDLYLKAKNKHRIKFGILIANHEGAEIVGEENWVEAVRCLSKYFKDEQHITIDGKPYLSIFNPNGLNQEERDAMQKTALALNIDSLSIVACGSAPNAKEYQYRTHYNAIPVGDNKGKPERDYNDLVEVTEREWVVTNQPYIPTVSVGWDPRPWKEWRNEGKADSNGWYFVNNTPARFKSSLLRAVEWIEAYPEATVKEKMVMIYAWNEFGEGGYLVPTKGDENGEHLRMIKEVVYSAKSDAQ